MGSSFNRSGDSDRTNGGFDDWFKRVVPEALIQDTAARLVGRYGFTISDVPDIEQELRLHVFLKLPQFDPSRAKLNTYLDRIIKRKVATMIEHRKRQRRDYRRETSFDPKVHDRDNGEHERRVDDLRLDLEPTLKKFPDDLQVLWARLSISSVAELSRLSRVERGQLRGQLRRLRQQFADAGLDEYLNDD